VNAKRIRRKNAPELFALLDRIQAIINLDLGKRKDLAHHLKTTPQRIYEWVTTRAQHPLGETALQMELWAAAHENNIRGGKNKAGYHNEILSVMSKYP
jgi:hypothetical protein